jgi:integrase
VASGSIETLKSGFRARVYAGKDPITHKQTYLRGEVRRSRADAEADKERLLALADSGVTVELKRTVGTLLDRWMETVDHELSTAETSAGYIRRTIKPALGDMPIRKLQHRVDILDKLYTHLRRCNQLCTGPMPGLRRRLLQRHPCCRGGGLLLRLRDDRRRPG